MVHEEFCFSVTVCPASHGCVIHAAFNAWGSAMKCPICAGPARDITTAGFDGISVRCPVDGDFDVKTGFALKLQELSPAKRHYLLNDAILAARPGSRPLLPVDNQTHLASNLKLTSVTPYGSAPA